MVPAQDDEQSASSGGDEAQTVLAERIGVQKTPSLLLIAYLVLRELIESIERGQIQIGRSIVLRPVSRIRAEQRVRHDGREGEGEGGVASRVGLELSPPFRISETII